MPIVFASLNQGKYDEMQSLFASENIEIVSMKAFDLVSPEETGLSFLENALIKARHAAQKLDCPVIADDSGLVVPALGGDPGVYSSRYAGDQASDKQNIDALLTALSGETNRFAYFVCVLVFLRSANDPVPLVAQGIWEGSIATEPSGTHGFGYDPVFDVSDHQCSAAALTAVEKSSISHRGQAFKQMLIAIQSMIRKEELCLNK